MTTVVENVIFHVLNNTVFIYGKVGTNKENMERTSASYPYPSLNTNECNNGKRYELLELFANEWVSKNNC